jgi:hypothetical protein
VANESDANRLNEQCRGFKREWGGHKGVHVYAIKYACPHAGSGSQTNETLRRYYLLLSHAIGLLLDSCDQVGLVSLLQVDTLCVCFYARSCEPPCFGCMCFRLFPGRLELSTQLLQLGIPGSSRAEC